MGQRHKHADVIIAWAEGKDVQVWDSDNQKWLDVVAKVPTFTCDEYRIKPPAKKYRVALFEDDSESYVLAANNQASADVIEYRKDFIRWLTDWIEYEE
mgnify:FL=1